jgi:hypothetical protein
MSAKLKSILSFGFWLSWSLIVGGILIIGVLLAPLAFQTLPTLVPDAGQALQFSGTLFTLFFNQYLPVCSLAFLFITIVEHLSIREDWKILNQTKIIRGIILLIGNGIWIYLALWLIPEMVEMVLDSAKWNTSETRVAFKVLHERSMVMMQGGWFLTLLLPFFAKHSHLRKLEWSAK